LTIDFLVIALIIIFFYRGYSKGIIIAVFSFLSLFVGAFVAWTYAAKCALYFQEQGWASSGWAPLVSYALLFIAAVVVVRFIGKSLEKITAGILLGWLNRTIGGLLYTVLALCVFGMVLWLLNQAHVISETTKFESKTYSYFERWTPWLLHKASTALSQIQASVNDMQLFFKNMNQHLLHDVDPH
jgi:membrane protein required for colicin V production